MYTVRLVRELFEWKQKVEESLQRGDKRDIIEYKLLTKAIKQLENDFKTGQILTKKNYPPAYKDYSRRFAEEVEIDKLWVLKVSKDWRVIYTVVGSEVAIISFILDSMDHKEYERKFNF